MIASLLEILKFEYFNLFRPYIFLCKIIKVFVKTFDVFLLVRMFRNALIYEKSHTEKTSRVMSETVSEPNASRYDRSGGDDC